jgi:hypothetical protein
VKKNPGPNKTSSADKIITQIWEKFGLVILNDEKGLKTPPQKNDAAENGR